MLPGPDGQRIDQPVPQLHKQKSRCSDGIRRLPVPQVRYSRLALLPRRVSVMLVYFDLVYIFLGRYPRLRLDCLSWCGSTGEGNYPPASCVLRRGTQKIYSFCPYRYNIGAASSFDGGYLVREANYGVVAVIIQYRLSVFGKYNAIPASRKAPYHIIAFVLLCTGFLSGAKVKENGALNAGLRECSFGIP